MTDRDDDADQLQDRLSKRFDSEKQSADTKQTKRTKQTKQKGSEDEGEQRGKEEESGIESNISVETVNYRSEWNTRLLYIPDDLSDLLEYEYKRLDLETDWTVKKEQHFYPVVVAHGVESIAEMDSREFTDAVRALGIEPS